MKIRLPKIKITPAQTVALAAAIVIVSHDNMTRRWVYNGIVQIGESSEYLPHVSGLLWLKYVTGYVFSVWGVAKLLQVFAVFAMAAIAEYQTRRAEQVEQTVQVERVEQVEQVEKCSNDGGIWIPMKLLRADARLWQQSGNGLLYYIDTNEMATIEPISDGFLNNIKESHKRVIKGSRYNEKEVDALALGIFCIEKDTIKPLPYYISERKNAVLS